MNCKPNDLALIIRGRAAGKLVTCLRLEDPGVNIPEHARGLRWLVDRNVEWLGNRGTNCQMPYCPDSHLMPIRAGGKGVAVARAVAPEVS